MTSFITSSPCRGKSDLRAAQALRHLQQKYIFVRKKASALIPKQLSPQPRNTRSDASSIPGTTYCPWKWVQDVDLERMPRSIMKAVCPGCAHFCRPVYYYHNVLIPKCDKKTGEKVWKWKEKELAVAYVYDPYNWITGKNFFPRGKLWITFGLKWQKESKASAQFHLVWSISKRKQILNFKKFQITIYVLFI